MDSESTPTLRHALVVGHLVSTVPSLLIVAMAVALFLLGPIQTTADWFRWAGAIALCPFSWLWTSIVTPRWRSWALRSGVDPEALYRWGRRTLLVPRRKTIFERSELYLSDRTFYGLLGGLLASTFLTVETLSSNFFQSVLSLPRPIGSLVAAAISAGVLWPIHNGLRRLLRRAEENSAQLTERRKEGRTI